MKRRTYLALFLTLMLSGGIVVFDTAIFSTPATAESFQSTEQLQFTLNPTISINISGNLTIESLSPGDYKDSNIITVTASSNAIAGYTLSGTVGNDTHSSPSFDNTNLNHTNGTNTFTNLSTNKASLSAFDENSNTWGYSWCSGTCTASTASTETTSWVSGNVGSTTQGYNGLPIYTTDSPIQFINSTSSDSSIISFKIGARSTATQIAGEYTNVINFIGVANPNPEIPTMQNLDPSLCTTTPRMVVDSRDNQYYTIQRLADNKCWMMTNLNLGATNITTDLNSTNTHIASGSTITASTFNAWNRDTSGTAASYTDPKFSPVSGTDSTSGTAYGTLYNYCAASANTYCYASGSGTGNASYDLCPAGWRLPTGGSGGEFATLYADSNYNTNAKMRAPISSGGAAFALAGYFTDSSPADQGSYGRYWSSTYDDGYSMYYLSLDTSDVSPTSSISRSRGYSVRCVLQ